MNPKTVKPGWKTTEFWGVRLVQAGALITALAGSLPPKWAVIAIAAAECAYSISRGLTKQGAGIGTLPPPA